jgi:hypothetical protein
MKTSLLFIISTMISNSHCSPKRSKEKLEKYDVNVFERFKQTRNQQENKRSDDLYPEGYINSIKQNRRGGNKNDNIVSKTTSVIPTSTIVLTF